MLVMIEKRRPTHTVLSVGLAGGLLSGITLGLFSIGIKQNSRTAIVQTLMTSAIEPDPATGYYVKIDNTGDGSEDVAYRWEWRSAAIE
jgi:hypothetical protein